MNIIPNPTDRNIFARLSRRQLTPADRRAPATIGGTATLDAPVDDNFYFETAITSPAVQLSVWELINDEQEPRDEPAGDDTLDEGVLTRGHTATVAFWAGEQGQKLIRGCDSGPSATQLGDWLAGNFPQLYGWSGQDLGRKTNAYIAAVIRRLARAAEPRLEAQVLALALACYATRESLGGLAATPFGFRVSPLGVAPCVCNIGPLGAPFQAANGSSLTVLQLLLALDRQATRGVPLAGNDTLRQQAHDLLDLVNRFGALDA